PEGWPPGMAGHKEGLRTEKRRVDVSFTSTVAPLGGSIRRDPPYPTSPGEYIKEPAMADLPNCETLLLSLDAGVLHITLNRPDSRNAMSLAMVTELRAVLESLRNDLNVRA